VIQKNQTHTTVKRTRIAAVMIARGANIPTVGGISSGETFFLWKNSMRAGLFESLLPAITPKTTAMGTHRSIIMPLLTAPFSTSGASVSPVN